MPNVNRKSLTIDVTRAEDDTLTVETPYYTLTKITQDELHYVTAPFVDFRGTIELDCGDDQDLADTIQKMFIQQGTWNYYFDSTHPAPYQYALNVQSKKPRFKIDGLKDIAKGKPIIFCGAGPSINEEYDTIREIITTGKGIVVAGGTGIRLLHDQGIVPHFCLAFDPLYAEYEQIFEHLTEEWMDQTVLIGYHYLNKQCFDKWSGPMIMMPGMSCIVNHSFIEGGEHILDGGIGVSTCMAHVAAYMGCKELWTVGVDMAYHGADKDDLNFYADKEISNTSPHVNSESPAHRAVEHQGKWTRPIWIQEADRIGAIIAQYDYKGYNTSKCGLTIPNAPYKKLKKVLKYESFEVKYDLVPYAKEDFDRIGKVTELLIKEFEVGFHYGIQSEEFKDTLAFKNILWMYHYIQSMREMWTRYYNAPLLEQVAQAWYQSLVEGSKEEKHESVDHNGL